jgi:hypothetical protein
MVLSKLPVLQYAHSLQHPHLVEYRKEALIIPDGSRLKKVTNKEVLHSGHYQERE